MLGFTVLADFILSEGIEKILGNLQRVGATAVACNPTVTVPADESTGSFQPPDDAGSSPRLFDRPLWGKRSLWVRSAPSFRPNETYYVDSPYSGRTANDLTEEYGPLIGEFIDAACDQGMKVFLQIRAAQPPGLREEDVPRLPNGQLPAKRIAKTASLASPAVRAYNDAYIRDLIEKYPRISGLRPDWPEYPCYTLGEAFADFGTHVETWAKENGFDFPRIRHHAGRLWDHLHGGLTNDDLQDFADHDNEIFSSVRLLEEYPGVADWLRLKAGLSTDILRNFRRSLDQYGGKDKKLSARAFMPPFSVLTGFDFESAALICDSISPKLFTMHWPLMVKFWGEEILSHNDNLDEQLIVRVLTGLFDLVDHQGGELINDYRYPLPEEPHPIPNGPQIRKIEEVLSTVGGRAEVFPMVHGYGPLADFRRRFELAVASRAEGVWINRYGYLSEEKLDAVAEICKAVLKKG